MRRPLCAWLLGSAMLTRRRAGEDEESYVSNQSPRPVSMRWVIGRLVAWGAYEEATGVVVSGCTDQSCSAYWLWISALLAEAPQESCDFCHLACQCCNGFAKIEVFLAYMRKFERFRRCFCQCHNGCVSGNLACLAAFGFVRTKNEVLWLFLNSGVLQAMGWLGSYEHQLDVAENG